MSRIFICLTLLFFQSVFAQTQGPGCLSPDAAKGKIQNCSGEDSVYKTPVAKTDSQSNINPKCLDVCKYGGTSLENDKQLCKSSLKAKKKSKDGICCCTLGQKNEEVRL